ncbi:MAG: hypothetical protein QOE27_683 [Solirubrobacteraceae bacterium]|nr:hypothetical protein [Solirubrobacteraceae bacterium]
MAATGEAVDEARAVKPAGGEHPQVGPSELADLGLLVPAAEVVDEELHPVADAEHRDPELEELPVEGRGSGRVDRRRPAGEDQAPGSPAGDLGGPDVVGQELGEHPALAHPAGDQLRVLPAVVEHDDLGCGDRPPGHPADGVLDPRLGQPGQRPGGIRRRQGRRDLPRRVEPDGDPVVHGREHARPRRIAARIPRRHDGEAAAASH